MIHVFPIDDIKEHKLEGTDCECGPKVVMDEGMGIVGR